MAERLLAADTATPFDDSADPNGPVRPGPTDTEVALDEIGSEVVRPETQDENTDGLIEQIQTSSDQLTEATGFLQEAARDITEIGEITAELNRGFDANAPANYVAQVRILDDLAARIAPAASRLEQRGRAFRSTVDGLADNVRFQLTWLTQHARSTGIEETATGFAANLEVLVANGETAVEGLTKMQHSLAPLQNVSKQLRPRIRNIDNGLTAIIEGTLLMTTWRPYIAALKVTLNDEVAP